MGNKRQILCQKAKKSGYFSKRGSCIYQKCGKRGSCIYQNEKIRGHVYTNSVCQKGDPCWRHIRTNPDSEIPPTRVSTVLTISISMYDNIYFVFFNNCNNLIIISCRNIKKMVKILFNSCDIIIIRFFYFFYYTNIV